jgi:ferritin-like metal-binding protein YciE
MRSDRPGRNARDAYIAEHTEIAAYEMLERLAMRLGDAETAYLARTIRHEEENMAAWITAHWDMFVDLTLQDAGIAQTEVLV